MGSVCAASQAGNNPAMRPAISNTAKQKLRIASEGETFTGTPAAWRKAIRTSRRAPAQATSNPTTPPMTASSMLSTNAWRRIRRAGAPSARGKAVRGSRAISLPSSRFATFAHPISKTAQQRASSMLRLRPYEWPSSRRPRPAGPNRITCRDRLLFSFACS